MSGDRPMFFEGTPIPVEAPPTQAELRNLRSIALQSAAKMTGNPKAALNASYTFMAFLLGMPLPGTQGAQAPTEKEPDQE